jgi:plastocyanin
MRPVRAALAPVIATLALLASTSLPAQQPAQQPAAQSSNARSSAAQSSAAVRGRATIAIPVSARRSTSAYASRSIAPVTLAPASELRHIVVFLREAPAQAVAPTRVEIRQRDEQFLPRVVAVPVGSEVSFPNDDPFYHNVFSLARIRTFNLGRFPRGQSRAVRFDKPGIVKVFCDIHSHMTATVMVFNHPWFTVPSDDGSFEIPDVPTGDREMTAWHERLGDTTIRTRVEGGRTASIEFVLPVPR